MCSAEFNARLTSINLELNEWEEFASTGVDFYANRKYPGDAVAVSRSTFVCSRLPVFVQLCSQVLWERNFSVTTRGVCYQWVFHVVSCGNSPTWVLWERIEMEDPDGFGPWHWRC